MSQPGDGTPTEPQYIRGVPHPLPEGERLLWEGAPAMKPVSTHVFHWRLIVAYFAAMLAFWAVSTEHQPGSEVYLASAVVRVSLSLFVLLAVLGLSRAVATTSWYAITSKRIVMRVGMAFPMSINIPFTIIESAGLGLFKDGTGQVTVTLQKQSRIAYIALWPHCRVFRFTNPEPVLRGLEEPHKVAEILATAVAEAAGADTRVERGGVAGRSGNSMGVPATAGA
ncbi:photosynthetic complex putative assembly protein PuhB [Gemmatimonas phototrophica]|uniref:photosynthetic complex putative assembly protein PuhB n=1 Tax=Gemmatimonas phototrophica TaxID=1379270 RepID=UPI0006A6E028|nr:photosynthetic complex putative assembly protein PuhB [Gemmatimonas phototrophica]